MALKTASITPRLKKPNMDDTNVRSFRPISNLPVVSKLIERLVAKRLINYLATLYTLPMFQSAYRPRPHHSEETAVAKVLSYILLALDEGDLACLALRDLFQPPSIPLIMKYCCNDVAHDWFRSYLIGRHQYVESPSKPVIMRYGVPQGSVLGPILFLLM